MKACRIIGGWMLGVVAALFFLPAPAFAWNLQGACAGSPATSSVGDTITWTATQTSTLTSPGEGHYEWVWSGTENLNGSAQSVQKMYATPGVKNATVLIKLVLASGKVESITRTCSVTITTPSTPELTGSCAATPGSGTVGSSFTWSALPTGGTGTYAYSWAGDEGLSATTQTVVKSYASTGAKNATVIITSGAQSVLRSCNVTITTSSVTPFDAVCSVSPSTANVGETIHWSALPTGGTGSYDYVWSGDEGLSGTAASIDKAYSNAGGKLGTVTVTSGSQSLTKTCAVSIRPPTTGCLTGCGGGLPQPNVVVFKHATTSTLASASVYVSQTPYTPSSIYLSQIPYTGVTEDNVKAVAFVALLLAVSGVVTYLISSRKKGDKHLFNGNARGERFRLIETTNNPPQPIELMTETIVEELVQEPVMIEPITQEPVVTEPSIRKPMETREPAKTADVSEFVSWLATGNSQKVFGALRAMRARGADTEAFVISLASELDVVYRSRLDAYAPQPPENTRRAVERWGNRKLEDVITTLVGAVDESYQSHDVSIKLALAKIMKLGA